jgi:putative endopeptidase
MNKSQKFALALTLLAALCLTAVFSQRSGSAQTSGQTGHGFDRASMDTSTPACTDFYQYANGGWLAANPIPAAFSSWGSLQMKRTDVCTKFEGAAKNSSAEIGSNERKVGDYYASCMDEARIEAEGLKTLQIEFNNIAGIRDQRNLQIEIAHLHSIGLNVLFNSGSNQDFKNSKEVTVGISQGGLGLPDRDYYTKSDEKSKTIRDQYLQHVARMFELMGDDAARAAVEAQTVMTLESKLAAASKTRVELRDPEKLYHRMPMMKVSDLAPNFDWPAYFLRIGLTQKPDVNVATPDSSRP